MPSFGKKIACIAVHPTIDHLGSLFRHPPKAVKISLKMACLNMHALRFMRKVDSLSSAMESSRRKLDKFEIRFTLFAMICICGTYTRNWHSLFLCHCPSRSFDIH